MTERKFLLKADEVADKASGFSHPWKPELGDHRHPVEHAGRSIADRDVSRVRIPAGKESFVYHSHHREEEWIYIISGRGVAEIDGEEFEVAAGDFTGFPTPSVAHHLRNPYEENLLYSVGGALDVEIADLPRLGKCMLRRGQHVEIYEMSDAKSFGPLDA